jgi:outer membrane putative beta-barrel porin/alpha-amylase
MRQRFILICVLCCLACSAYAGPPYFTDDPEPVDFHHWETYIASQYLHANATVSATLPHVELNYGAAPNLQLHIIAPMAFNQASGQNAQYGYGDTELGVKYRFVQEGKNTPMVGVFPLVEIPTGDASKGLGSGQTQFFLPVWLQKGFGDWQTYGGGGYWRNPGAGNRDYWFLGWQVQKQVTKSWSVGGEVFHTTPSTVGGDSRTGFNVGTIYDLDEGHHLLFSVGKDIAGSHAQTMYLGFQWTFGPKEK